VSRQATNEPIPALKGGNDRQSDALGIADGVNAGHRTCAAIARKALEDGE